MEKNKETKNEQEKTQKEKKSPKEEVGDMEIVAPPNPDPPGT